MGIQMLLFYMVIYMISGLAIWSIFLLLNVKNNKIFVKYNKELGDFALLKKSNSTMAFSLALTMFSIAGIPPMIGFLAKMSVFLSVIGITFYFVALVSIVFSVVSTFYYIRLIKILYFENLLVGKLYYPITTEKTVILSILVFSLIFLFLNPTLLYLFSYKVVLSLV
jgi:NADH-quinone oxidoreductase subunit N